MAKKVALNRLRQISKHRALRAPAIADPPVHQAEHEGPESVSNECSTASSARV